MSIDATISKLQLAIKLNADKVIKLSTSQFYSEEENKMFTKYTLTTPEAKKNKKGEIKVKDEEIFSSYSKVAILKKLASIFRNRGDTANGE